MWWLMVVALTAPASAQRPRCDFGTGVEALRDAQSRLAAPVAGLLAGREAGLTIAAVLDTARDRFVGCACPRLAEQVDEAARLAEQAGYEASAVRIAQTFAQAGFRTRLARQLLDGVGCR